MRVLLKNNSHVNYRKYQKDHPQLPFFNLKNMNQETQTQKFIAAYKQLQRVRI